MKEHWADIRVINLRERKQIVNGIFVSEKVKQATLKNEDYFKFLHEENWRMCDQKVREIEQLGGFTVDRDLFACPSGANRVVDVKYCYSIAVDAYK